MSHAIYRAARAMLRPAFDVGGGARCRCLDPDEPDVWTTILPPEVVAQHLAALGDSAIAYWTSLPDVELSREMASASAARAGLRYQIARSIIAARQSERAA